MAAQPSSAPRVAAIATLVLCGMTAAAAMAAARAILPRDGKTARGLRIRGVEIPAGADPGVAARDQARRALSRRVRLTWDGEEIARASLAELGATVDTDILASEVAQIGHEPDLFTRLDAALEARRGRINLQVPVRLPIDRLAALLDAAKDDRDTPPMSARLDFSTGAPTDHRPGRYLDIYAAAAAIDRALATHRAEDGEQTVAIPAFEVDPSAPRDVVAAIDVSQVLSSFQTRFGYLGPEKNRASNIRRASSLVDGVVLMPQETISFNRLVGPRSIENGFATAPEIYKGEMREGIGGGTCQVSGTLHAAAFFGGLEIVDRSNHSRPSGYIRIGLDATVVYPTVDLKLRNPYTFPIVLHATIDKGKLSFEIRGRERPATVELATATVGVEPFKRKVEEASWIKEGEFVLKQKGRRGQSIRKTRTIHLASGQRRVEVTTDVYPPTFEIYLIPPGADADEILPPLLPAEGPAPGAV